MGNLDDSRMEEEHLDHLRQVFVRLCGARLKLKLQKCSFFTVDYSGIIAGSVLKYFTGVFCIFIIFGGILSISKLL